MRTIITLVFLTIALCLAVPSFAQYNNGGNPSINGTVVSVDQTFSKITVSDTLTGNQKIFTVSPDVDLGNFKTGDKVTVTIQDDDPTKAVNIVKQ